MSAKAPQELFIADASRVFPVMQQALKLVEMGIKAGAVVVTLGRPNKSREQEKKYHALINDIRAQGRAEDPEGVMRLLRDKKPEHIKAALVDAFADEMAKQGTPLRHPGEHTWNWISKRFVSVRPSTREFSKDEAAAFIEYLYSVGSDMGVIWSPIVTQIYDECREAQNKGAA